MKKAAILIIPIIFTAQACNFLFGDLGGNQRSGSRGVFVSDDGGQSWAAANTLAGERSISNVQVTDIFIEPDKTDNILLSTHDSGIFASDSRAESWVSLLPGIIAYRAVINPENSEEIFASGASRRTATIYKSPDRGGSWIQLFTDPAGPSSVTSLVFARQNSRTLFAGLSTGRVLMSTDGGQTWKAQSSINERIEELVSLSGAGQLLALSQSGGLRRSADFGQNWTNIEISATERPAQFNEMVLDPQNSAVIYLGTDKGLFRSVDAGVSWSRLSLPATAEQNNVTGVAVNPKDNSQIFAAIRATIYRSDDRGNTWRTISLPTQRTISKIEIDPMEPNRIYAGFR